MGCDFRFVASLQDSQLEWYRWLADGWCIWQTARLRFLLTVGRNNKEVHLVSIGKLVLVVVVPQDILIVNIIGTEVLCMDDHTQAGFCASSKIG